MANDSFFFAEDKERPTILVFEERKVEKYTIFGKGNKWIGVVEEENKS